MKVIKVFAFSLLIIFSVYAEDKVVDTLLNRAINNDYKLRSLNYQKNAKKYQEEQSKAKYKPTINFSSYLGWQEYKPYYGGKTQQTLQYYYLSLKQPIFHPELLQDIKKSKLYTKIADLQIKQEKQYIKYLFYSSLVDYVYSSQVEELYRERLNLYKEKYNLTVKLFEENKITKLQLISVEESYRQAFIDYKNSQYEKQQFIRNLKIITNYEDALPEIRFNPEVNLENKPFSYWKDMLKDSYQIRQAKISVEIAKREINIRKFQRYPKVDLEISYRYSSTSAVSVASDDKRIAFIIDFPIYQGGLMSASVLEAKELQKAAVMDFKQTERDNLLQLKDAYSQLKTNLENVKQQLKKINLLEKKLISVKEAFDKKVVSKLTLIDTKIQLTEEKIKLLSYKRQTFTGYIKLLYTVSKINDVYERTIKKLFREVKYAKDNN